MADLDRLSYNTKYIGTIDSITDVQTAKGGQLIEIKIQAPDYKFPKRIWGPPYYDWKHALDTFKRDFGIPFEQRDEIIGQGCQFSKLKTQRGNDYIQVKLLGYSLDDLNLKPSEDNGEIVTVLKNVISNNLKNMNTQFESAYEDEYIIDEDSLKQLLSSIEQAKDNVKKLTGLYRK